jgi:hypothetical protein
VISPARLIQQHSARVLAAAVALGTALLAPSVQAAISVGATGSGLLTFNTLPTNTEWSTLVWTGAPGDITNAATMDSAVAALTASGITNTLGTATVWPPGGNTLARYNSAQNLLQMRPTGSVTKGVVLLATLQNTSGSGITNLIISYTMGTPVTGNTEQVPGLRAYYSLTGAADSWTVIPALCTNTAGTLTTDVPLSWTWANATTMYVLWAQDNNNATSDNAYTIDNVSFAPPSTLTGNIEAVSVNSSGQATLNITAIDGVKYQIVYKNSLLDPGAWLPVIPTNWTSGTDTGPLSLQDTNTVGVTQRFYRVESKPKDAP